MRPLIVGLILSSACIAQTQIITVRNAASASALIAPGSLIELVPQPNRIIAGDTSRISVQVRPSGGAEPLEAPVLSRGFLTLWARLPDSLPLGPAQITLTIDGVSSAPASVTIVSTGFGLFTQALNGLGPALAQNQSVGQPPSLNNLTHPALPDQWVILWGTGLGSARVQDVTIELGGKSLTTDYAGPAPGALGLDQINVRLPPDLRALDGCYVSLVVKAGGNSSNSVTISKASQPGPCQHPLGLSSDELTKLDQGARILFGSILLQSDVVPPPGSPLPLPRREAASASFLERGALDIALLAQPAIPDDTYFGCALSTGLGITGAIFTGDVDAGETLSLAGPERTLSIPRSAPSSIYNLTLDPGVLQPGTWRISGPGGKTIAPFQAETALPPPIRWTNRDALATIDRRQDQNVLWEASGYADSDVATVILSQIVCRSPAKSGSLTIPAALLQSLPEPIARPTLLQLRIAPRQDRRTLFPLPLTDGSTAHAVYEYSFSDAVTTQIR